MQSPYNDNTGLFEDFNFKLIVIDALLERDPDFIDELCEMSDKYCETFVMYEDSSPIEEMIEYFENLSLSEDDLDKITELCMDGGNEIYYYICPDWDGEDNIFDVTSISGFKCLVNLTGVEYSSMGNDDIIKDFEDAGIEIL